jgi:hypothetical protein
MSLGSPPLQARAIAKESRRRNKTTALEQLSQAGLETVFIEFITKPKIVLHGKRLI